MTKRKRQQQRRALPERQQLVMRAAARSGEPARSQRAEPSSLQESTGKRRGTLCSALYVQPSLFEGIGSVVDLLPTMDDMPLRHLTPRQADFVSLLSDYLALQNDRQQVSAAFQRRILQTLMQLSGERRAIARDLLASVDRNQSQSGDCSGHDQAATPHA